MTPPPESSSHLDGAGQARMGADPGTLAWPIATERLSIRPARAADLPRMYDYRSLHVVSEWLPTHPTDRSAFIERQRSRLPVTFVLEHDGVLVGDLYLAVSDGWAQVEVSDGARNARAEIGWALDPAHQGRGFATEAAAELLRICFDDLGVRRVEATCFAANTGSWKVMERVGMHRECLARENSLHRSGRWLDGVTYALLAREWRDGRGRRSPGSVGGGA